MEPDQARRIFLIAYPRTASNLLLRILALEKQPNVLPLETGGYFFLPTLLRSREKRLSAKHIDEWTQDEKNQMMQSYQDCAKDLARYLKTAQDQGRHAFFKEHGFHMSDPVAQSRFLFGERGVKEPPWTVPPSTTPSMHTQDVTRSTLNETVLPDEFLQTLLPIFLIRHPALAFPSYYRTIIDNYGERSSESGEQQLSIVLNLYWTRTLYDWYTQHLSKPDFVSDTDVAWPLVLDADDIVTEPGVTVRLCELIGLDTQKLQFTWEMAPVSKEELDKMLGGRSRRMLSTLLASSGIVQGKTWDGLDIDTEVKKRRDEFGETQGRMIEKFVKDAMPDYEFLKSKTLWVKAA